MKAILATDVLMLSLLFATSVYAALPPSMDCPDCDFVWPNDDKPWYAENIDTLWRPNMALVGYWTYDLFQYVPPLYKNKYKVEQSGLVPGTRYIPLGILINDDMFNNYVVKLKVYGWRRSGTGVLYQSYCVKHIHFNIPHYDVCYMYVDGDKYARDLDGDWYDQVDTTYYNCVESISNLANHDIHMLCDNNAGNSGYNAFVRINATYHDNSDGWHSNGGEYWKVWRYRYA